MKVMLVFYFMFFLNICKVMEIYCFKLFVLIVCENGFYQMGGILLFIEIGFRIIDVVEKFDFMMDQYSLIGLIR